MRKLFASLVVCLCLAGCGNEEDPGGTYTFHEGKVTLEVPAGAVLRGITFAVEPVSKPPATPRLVANTVYDLEPDGVTFNKPVKLTIRYAAADVPPGTLPASLLIHKLVGSAWTPMPGGVDTAKRLAWASLSGFSKYGVKGRQGPTDAGPDSAADAGPPADGAAPDAAKPDAAKADLPQVPDLPKPDLPQVPDLPKPDLPQVPDLPKPDLPLSDATPPDTTAPGGDAGTKTKVCLRVFGNTTDVRSRAVAVDPAGNTLIAGDYQEPVAFGKTTLPGYSGYCDPYYESDPAFAFVARQDKTGAFTWAHTLKMNSCSTWVYANAVAMDATGNSYVAGTFDDLYSMYKPKFGSLNPAGPGNEFVTKINSAGAFQWVTTAKTGGINGVAADSAGNTYVTGSISGYGSSTFGSTTLSSMGKSDIFVARLNSKGAYVWAVPAGGSAEDNGKAITVDATGNSTVTGYFSGTATFGTTKLSAKGKKDLFVARVSPSGTFLWAVSAGGSGAETSGNAVGQDKAGNAVVAGTFSGTISASGATLPSKGAEDVLVLQLDKTGKVLWSRSMGGAKKDEGNGVAVDGAGNATVTGAFLGSVAFGSTTLTSGYSGGAFVARLDSKGKVAWAKAVTGGGSETGHAAGANSAGEVSVTGTYSGATLSFGTTSPKIKYFGGSFVGRPSCSWTAGQVGPTPACVACCKKCSSASSGCHGLCSTSYTNGKLMCDSNYSSCMAGCGDSYMGCNNCWTFYDSCKYSEFNGYKYCTGSCTATFNKCRTACGCVCP